jgi:hypothetical protein
MKILKVKSIPEWVIESDKACFHPFSNTIYLTKWRYLPHELWHVFWYRLGFGFDTLPHRIIDYRKCEFLCYKGLRKIEVRK